jgi:hypothetical protein
MREVSLSSALRRELSAADAQLNNWHERLKSVWSVESYMIVN